MKIALSPLKILFAALFIFILSCGKKNSSLPLINFSFELSGVGSVAGWYHFCDSSAAIPVYNNSTPPGGGAWSLSLQANNPPSCYARKYFTGQNGTNIYRLKGWIKDVSSTGSPLIKIGKYNSGIYTQMKLAISPGTSTNWMSYELYDTITTISTDTIAVEVSGGFHSIGGTGLFDLITLEKID